MRQLRYQLSRFFISGIMATGGDFLCYNLITLWLDKYALAKYISFLVGTIVAFFYNKYITFKHIGKTRVAISKFLTLYLLSLLINVTSNSVLLEWLNYAATASFLSKAEAFLVATLFSMVLNFCGQKFWVFRVRTNSA